MGERNTCFKCGKIIYGSALSKHLDYCTAGKTATDINRETIDKVPTPEQLRATILSNSREDVRKLRIKVVKHLEASGGAAGWGAVDVAEFNGLVREAVKSEFRMAGWKVVEANGDQRDPGTYWTVTEAPKITTQGRD